MNKPKTITPKEAQQLNYWLEGRFKVMFELAKESGLRVSDILALKVRDISNPMTVYEKKSKRKRTFPISEELHTNLLYLADFKTKDDFVFESHKKRGVAVNRSTFHRQIKKALKWLEFDASAHSARKLYAKTVFDETGSIESVQRALNHHKISTTYTYLDIPQQNPLEEQKTATQKPKRNIFGTVLTWLEKIINFFSI